MKKSLVKLKKYLFVGLFLVLFGWYFSPYFRGELPLTHDGENHLARFAQYYLAFKQGQVIPRVGPALDAGYGYPVFNFNYPLANILSLPLTVLHVSFEWEFKILTITFVTIGLLATIAWWRRLFASQQISYVALIAFLLAPYLWSAIWYRGNIGEIIMFCWLPVVALAIERVRTCERGSGAVLSLVLLVYFLAHNVMTLFAAPVVIAYAWWRLHDREQTNISLLKRFFDLFGKDKMALSFVWALLAVGMSLWFWLPALAEKSFTVLDAAGLSHEYEEHFATWQQLLNPAIHGGFSYSGCVDGLSFGGGWILLGVLVVSIYLLATRQERCFCQRRLAWVLTIGALVLVWLQTAASAWLWRFIPLAHFIQFPWRLGMLWQWLMILQLANIQLSRKDGTRLWCGLIFLQIVTFACARPVQFFSHDRDYYLTYPMTTSTARENRAQSFEWDITLSQEREPLIATGSGEIFGVERLETTRKDYHVRCEDHCLVIEHTAYFPGFVTRANGAKVQYYDDGQIAGRVAFWLPDGEYEITERFQENTWARMSGDIISIICTVVWAWLAYKEFFGHRIHLFGKKKMFPKR